MRSQLSLAGFGLAAVLALGAACGDDATTTGDAAVTTDAITSDSAAIPGDGGGTTGDGGATDAATGDGGGATGDGGATTGDGGGATGDGGAPYALSTDPWTVFDPAGPAKDIKGSVKAYDLGGGKTKVTLEVSGLAPSFKYGSHVHKLACADMMGGGHYQHVPSGDAAATDPMFANATNEIWLDVMTDATGKGSSEATVDWKPRSGEAKSVVVHAMMTGAGGVAGARLACVNVAF